MIELFLGFVTGCLMMGGGLMAGAFVERRNISRRIERVERRQEVARLALEEQNALERERAELRETQQRRERLASEWQVLQRWTGSTTGVAPDRLPILGDLRAAFEDEDACRKAIEDLQPYVDFLPGCEPRFRSSMTAEGAWLESASNHEEFSRLISDIFGEGGMKIYIHRLATTKLCEIKAERLDNAWQQATPAPARARF